MFTRSFVIIFLLASCSSVSNIETKIYFDNSFSNQNKFFLKSCLFGTKLQDLTFKNLSITNTTNNVNALGLEIDRTISLSFEVFFSDERNLEINENLTHPTNYLSSNMAIEEDRYLIESLFLKACNKIINSTTWLSQPWISLVKNHFLKNSL